MSGLALKSTTRATFVGVGPGRRIVAVRAEGGEVEVLGHDRMSGATCRLQVQPTSHDLGWVTLPESVAWSEFRAISPIAECIVHMAAQTSVR
jgi:hypothetical protein